MFSCLNQAHPFREGNGRTSKVFMEHVAQRSRFTLDYSRVTPLEWDNASMLSATDLGTYAPVPDSLVPVFRAIAVGRTSTSTLGVGPAARRLSPLSASYPNPASEATQGGAQQPGAPPRRSGPYPPGRGYGGTGRGEGR